MNEPVYLHADEPWAAYYLAQNRNWATETNPMARWKLGSSRKALAIDTWRFREAARLEYAADYGDDPGGWPERHLTVVVHATNKATPVCIECLWLDGDYWDDRGARAAGRTHTLESR